MDYNKDNRLDEDDENELWDDDLDLTSEPAAGDYNNESDWTANYEDTPYDEGIPNDYDRDEHEEDAGSYSDEQDNDYDDEDAYGHIHSDSHHQTHEPEDYYSEPEPKQEPKSRRGRLFGRNNDEDGNDFYDSDAEPEPVVVKKPKVPKLDPEDPDYWMEEESPLSSILPTPKKRWKWWLAGCGILLVLIIGVWIWFFRPYADNAVKYGYIRDMERRGWIMKTFEGTMIPYKELGDPNPLQFEILPFSVESDSLAAVMKRLMLNCVPVRVEYEMYHTPLPWKGEAHMIIIKADSADTNKILPPDYRR